jgi:hypothetical protein
MESWNRRRLLGAAAAAAPLAVAPGLVTPASASPKSPQPAPSGRSPYAEVLPNVPDTSHATAETVALFRGYYTAKSRYEIDAFIDFFNPGAGRLAIGRYLRRALSKLPYGPGSDVLHVVGSEQGSGYDFCLVVGWNPWTCAGLCFH